MLYSGYTVNFGHFCQVVLALNRFTAIMMPLRHNDVCWHIARALAFSWKTDEIRTEWNEFPL